VRYNNYSFLLFLLHSLCVIFFCSACYSSDLRNDASITFISLDGVVSQNFYIQVAKTPDETRRGLMYRRSMPDNHGMLFVFDGMTERSFWMKNTYIPLDMIFIDDNGKVVNIISDVPPLSSTSRKSIYPCKYVLELNAGKAASGGITVGSVMKVSPDTILKK
jgi:uncharacterized protein